jgi:hypothetical protein
MISNSKAFLFWTARRWLLACTLLAPGGHAISAQGQDFNAVRVPLEDIQAVMQTEAEKGYNLRVVTNAGRLTSAVLLTLAGKAAAERPSGPPLLLHHEDWYAAYQNVTGLSDQQIPEFISLQLEYRQDQIVDYSAKATILEVKKGPTPKFVVHVTAQWPDGPDVPKKYSFTDTLPNPNMKVVNERVVTYYLLDFGDMIVQDEIQGIAGRPTEGALSVALKVVGDGHAVQSRFAIVEGGLVITHAAAKKGFIRVKTTSTTFPDGTMIKDTPEDRPELEAVAERLRQPLEIEYSSN